MPDRNLLELEILLMQGPEGWADWHFVGDSLQPLGTEKKGGTSLCDVFYHEQFPVPQLSS